MSDIPLAKIYGVEDVRLEPVPFPVCGPDDVVVQVRQCGICGTDLGFFATGGLMGPGDPLAIGHEFWGLVHEKGANITQIRTGDRVVVQPVGGDKLIGNGGTEGGFSPYILIRGVAADPSCILTMPDAMPDLHGALVEPLAVAAHGVNRIEATPDDQVVIFGAGPIGLSLLMVLQYRGLKKVVVVDLSQKRLELAKSLGAQTLHGDDPDLQARLIDLHGSSSFFGMPMAGSNVYFEATGVRQVFENIVSLAGPGSRICLTGVHKQPVTMDLVMMLAKELSIVAAMGYQQEFPEVMAMLQSGKFDPSVMVTHDFPLSEIQEAFAVARDQESAVKVIIDCQG